MPAETTPEALRPRKDKSTPPCPCPKPWGTAVRCTALPMLTVGTAGAPELAEAFLSTGRGLPAPSHLLPVLHALPCFSPGSRHLWTIIHWCRDLLALNHAQLVEISAGLGAQVAGEVEASHSPWSLLPGQGGWAVCAPFQRSRSIQNPVSPSLQSRMVICVISWRSCWNSSELTPIHHFLGNPKEDKDNKLYRYIDIDI